MTSPVKPALEADYDRVSETRQGARRPTGVDFMELGKLLIFVGLALVAAGVVVLLLGRMNLHMGRLPGDFLYRGKNTTVYFPLATSLLVSVVLSIVLYWISRWRR